jgi:ALTTAQ repeat
VIDIDPAVPPTITGTVAGQTTTLEAPVKPFSSVTIGDDNSGAADTLTIRVSGTGGTLSGTGLSGGTGGVYTLSGSATVVTGELDALSFTPTAGAPNSSSTSTFTLSDKSSAYATATVDSATTVIDTDPAVAPTITGTVAGQTTTLEAPIDAFSVVTITDANNGGTDIDTLSITLSGGGTLSGTGLSGSNGSYTLSGTAAAITTDLDALSFTPTAGTPNTSSTSTFMLSDKSSAYATATVDSATTVIDTDPAVAPTITGTAAGQTTTLEAPINAFSVVTITDANNGGTDIDTLSITLSGGGTLSGTGLSGSNGSYTLSGTAAAITNELRALSFTPVDGVLGTSVTTTFTLSDTSSAGTTSLQDSTTSVIDTDPAPADLTPAEIASLTIAEIESLTTAQIAALTTTQVDALTTVQMGSLSAAQVAALTAADVASLSTAQVTVVLASLTPTEIAALTTTQVDALTTAQIASLTTAQVDALTTAQIASLTSAQVDALTTTQLGSLSATQVAGCSCVSFL